MPSLVRSARILISLCSGSPAKLKTPSVSRKLRLNKSASPRTRVACPVICGAPAAPVMFASIPHSLSTPSPWTVIRSSARRLISNEIASRVGVASPVTASAPSKSTSSVVYPAPGRLERLMRARLISRSPATCVRRLRRSTTASPDTSAVTSERLKARNRSKVSAMSPSPVKLYTPVASIVPLRPPCARACSNST